MSCTVRSTGRRSGPRWSARSLYGPVTGLLRRLSGICLHRQDSIDPLTRLPGRKAVERNIRHRLSRHRPFVAIYWGLDNLAPFRARHGLLQGDHMVRNATEHLHRHFGSPQIFNGQFSHEDFVTLLEEGEDLERRVHTVLAAFEAETASCFSPTERRRNGFLSHRPTGEAVLTPLTSMVAGAVKVTPHQSHDTAGLLQWLEQARRCARVQDGPRYFIDRRDPWYLHPEA